MTSSNEPIDVGFTLADGEALHREYPDTFFIPTRTDRESLRPGSLVKLIFDIADPEDGEPGAERMWVQVLDVQGARYVGSLDNQPQVITTVSVGSPIEFGPQHIVEVWDETT